MKKRFWTGFFTGILTAIVLGIIGSVAFVKYAESTIADRLTAPELPKELKENFDFRYSTLTGETKYVSGLKGKVVFVNFWGTWCIPCVAEMPTIQKLYDSYRNDTDVVFVIASRLDNAAQIKAFAAKHNYTLPFYIISDKDIPASMNFNQYPTTFIYAKDGSVAMKHVNASDWADTSVISFINKLKAQ